MEIKDEHFAKLLLTYSGQGITLVNTNENHYKFWNIKINEDNSMTVTWGRIGQKIQTTTLPPAAFPDHVVNKAVQSKLSKGYEVFSSK